MLINAITTASNAMTAQSQRLEAVAQAVASIGTTPPASEAEGAPGAPVRIGALPVGDAIESLVTLAEVELAYRMNAAVIGTAISMLDSLLDIVDHDRDDK
jgi:flagellar basal body rod protein FlgC